ncbi:MAG TPA: adenylosuccinate lyase [Desulfobacterales bacterium]|nr:adenylosuccinate lyase [Desulfobacterales bacterium]
MIPRYSRPRMARIWTEENKFQTWLEVELAALEAMAQHGLVPKEAVGQIREKARFDVQRIEEIEVQTRHDVIAFLTNVAEYVGDEGRYLHYALTSSDILDTANALRLRQAADLLLEDLDLMMAVLKDRALEFKHTVCIGRSHGIHAEPMTFGLKFALWYAEMKRHRERLLRARAVVSVGKFSGAVGTFAHLPPAIEETACALLNLTPAPLATQVIQRDRYAEYFTTLALIGGSLEKIAVEIRHLQRTEVREAEEFFRAGQKGSSAMPHKRNPVLSENITGLSRLLRGNALAAMENMVLWHERDISHSSVERIIAPDSTILLDFMLGRLTGLLKNLLVYPDNMKKNLELTRGLIFSQRLMLELVRKGITREDAYLIVQGPAMRVWQAENLDFPSLIRQDAEIAKHLTKEEIDAVFALSEYLKHVDFLFQRVFGD